VDFDLFDRDMLLTFGKDFCDMIVGVATGWPYPLSTLRFGPTGIESVR
jgi:hypothetical protein